MKTESFPLAPALLSRLCLGCGLCCNGVLFADVCLVAGDDPDALRGAGLPIEPRRAAPRRPSGGAVSGPTLLPWRFRQPCPMLGTANRCEVYAERPGRCRAFQCALYQRVARDSLLFTAAQRRIAAALRRVRRVTRLLEQLGEQEMDRPLFVRVRNVRRSFERQLPDRGQAAVYADLTVAAHELRLILDRDFTSLEQDGGATVHPSEKPG